MPCLRSSSTLLPLVIALLLCSRISGSSTTTSASSRCSCCENTNYSSGSFSASDSSSGGRLVLLKDAEISNGALRLTPGSSNDRNSSGAALLQAPVTLWCQDSQEMQQNATFKSSFTMNVVPEEVAAADDDAAAGWNGGEALAGSGSGSGSLGDDFIAVKFSTVKQQPGDNRTNLSVSVFVSSLSNPTTNKSMGLPAATRNYTVRIYLDGENNNLTISVAVEGRAEQTIIPGVNVSGRIPQRAFVGFLASTGAASSDGGLISSWNLTVTVTVPDDDQSSLDWKVILPAVVGGIAFTGIMNIFVAAFYFQSRYNKMKMELSLSETLRRLPGMPREFKHAAMRKATDNFHEARRLGTGACGAVYRGTLRPSAAAGRDGGAGGAMAAAACVEVAVKKFTRDKNRCYDDFLAEVDIINRLRHRNIVPLVGWCYEKGELLLIYEYMPNGSLDQHLFPNKEHPGRILGWTSRYNIVVDVAAGLHYVHHEHEHMVLHRDIKASNIMLDSTFHGRLGDFGLARIVGLDKNSYTDLGVAGTWGFIAPEYSVSHKATRKTDMYAFGVLVLEIVTGRQALSVLQDTFQLLTDWVWRLHREGRLLEAVDKKVVAMDDYDADGAARLLLLGLACTSPNPLDRPSIADAVQVVAKTVPAPVVPLVKPTFMWPPEEGMLPHGFDDITEMSDIDESCWEETSSSDALAASAIIRRKARAVSVS
ncbi:hypothetical protein U9M48_012046 [Paspalum notatum var. saurae]|uniref:Protein kinase domain-containing protein n=1 Tax=Paspalum notatum var. saurae TaxID=547442 RepID=A0AAQ3SY85_PASNO